MTHTVLPATAQALKAAGFAQPEPKAGQYWYCDQGYFVIYYINHGIEVQLHEIDTPGPSYRSLKTFSEFSTFAPTLEDITPHLPPTFALEMWGGQPSCTNRDEGNPLRTLGENFAEAAAEMWLKIQKSKIK